MTDQSGFGLSNKPTLARSLGMKSTTEVYQPSPRPYQELPGYRLSLHDKIIVVTNCGRICLGRTKINLSTVFAGQAIGLNLSCEIPATVTVR